MLPKIVILLNRFPFPLEKGDKLRAYHQIKSLATRFEIHLICLSFELVSPEHKKELEPFCRQIEIFYLSKQQGIKNILKAVFKQSPFQNEYFFDPVIAEKIKFKIEAIQPQLIYVQLARMANYALNLPYKKILDFQDAFSANYNRSAKTSKWGMRWIYQWEYNRMKKFEQLCVKSFDAITIISSTDKKEIGDANIKVVTNGVDTHFFAPNNAIVKEYDIVFVGNLSYYPNVQAVKYIINELLPMLLKQIPEIKICIAGAQPNNYVQQIKHPNVSLLFSLPDIRLAYLPSKISIAPLFAGAGMQNKVLEAMACGLPVVATSIVNNAIHAIENEQIYIANDVSTFIIQIIELLKEPTLQQQIGSSARDFVKEQYSWSNCNAQLLSIIDNMIT
jgi:polysaccharide biosynthesis protein PslH